MPLSRKASRPGNKERKKFAEDRVGKGGGAKRRGLSGARLNTMDKLFGKFAWIPMQQLLGYIHKII